MADGVAVRYGTAQGRWVIIAAVLGSGVVFLDGTVVNVALPALSRDLDASVRGLQWILDSYLVTLSALLLLGGSAGDRYGRRRMFVAGLGGFVVASVLCGLAPGVGFLIVARALQGVAGALLVPASLSIISSAFDGDDRGRAIGAWSGLAAVAGAVGPLLGGWLVDAGSWRLIFFLNVPVAAAAAAIALRHVPETRDDEAGPLDMTGATLVSAGIALVAYGLIEHTVAAGLAGVAALVAFVAVEAAQATLRCCRSRCSPPRQFTGANLTTVAVYGAMSAALFLVTLRLQVTLGYSALEAGASFLPFTGLMLVLSARVGSVAQQIGPRLPMTVGPLLSAAGLLLFSSARAGRPLRHRGATGRDAVRSGDDGDRLTAHRRRPRRRRTPPGRGGLGGEQRRRPPGRPSRHRRHPGRGRNRHRRRCRRQPRLRLPDRFADLGRRLRRRRCRRLAVRAVVGIGPDRSPTPTRSTPVTIPASGPRRSGR